MRRLQNASFPLILLSAVFFSVAANAELQRVRVGGGIPPATILVTERGVIPDDGNDDTAALQDVLDSVKGGTQVIFPTGTYEITRTLTVHSHTELSGKEKGGPVLRFKGTVPCPMLEIRNERHVNLFDLTLDAAASPCATQGIVVAQSERVFVQDVTIRDFSTKEGFGPHAIFFSENVTDSAILHCTLENISVDSPWGAGVRIAKGSCRNSIIGNAIRNTGRGGILCNESSELTIQKNTVSGSHGEGLGIELWGGCPQSVVEENEVDHWISVDKSPYTAVRRNRITDPSGPIKAIGLELVDSSDCVFADNVVDGGQQIGISVSNTGPKERILWARNTVRRCVTWNAQLQGESGGAAAHVFWRNTFEGALFNAPNALYPGQGYGVRFNGNCANMLFVENTFADNGHGAVQTCGENLDGLRFVRNSFAGSSGPLLTGTPGLNPCWSENRVSGDGPGLPPDASNGACTFALSVSAAPAPAVPGSVTLACTAQEPGRTLAHVLWDFGKGRAQTGASVTLPASPTNTGKLHFTVMACDQNGVPAVLEQDLALTSPTP